MRLIETLWGMIGPGQAQAAPARAGGKKEKTPGRARRGGARRKAPTAKRPGAKADLYERMTMAMLARHQVRVRRWRTSMSGVAWYVTYKDGRVQRLIEAPRPKGPMSAAVFLHEVGHHAIGFDVYKPRCLEEYHAWKYALAQMEEWGVEITDRVQTRVRRSLRYAVRKAQRRGIKRLPEELHEYA
ncbi:MAG TPA: hypothetical protein VD971_06515 [Phycisphaerales bacterium]|nr:hypothetical protein [Phycisphaerales bacterium]